MSRYPVAAPRCGGGDCFFGARTCFHRQEDIEISQLSARGNGQGQERGIGGWSGRAVEIAPAFSVGKGEDVLVMSMDDSSGEEIHVPVSWRSYDAD